MTKRCLRWCRHLLWPGLLFLDAYLLGAALARNTVATEVWISDWLLSPGATVLRILVPARGGAIAGQWWTLHLLAAMGAVWFLTQRRPPFSHPDPASRYGSHGSARWATMQDLRQTLKASGPGLILGQFRGRLLIHPPDKRLLHNQLVAIFGGSGSRKTRSWVIPNTLHESRRPPVQSRNHRPERRNFRTHCSRAGSPPVRGPGAQLPGHVAL